MPTKFLARSTPYRPNLRADQRICPRCGITYQYNTSRPHLTHCRDCRDYTR